MNANHTLDMLVSQMSIEERLRLLEKIRENSPITIKPLYEAKSSDWGVSFEELYVGLPWIVRLFYRIVGLFTSRTASKVYENRRMLAMAREIEADAPGIFSYKQNRLLDGFYRELVALKDAARFFYNVLDTSINKDRGAFYAVLGSLEMEDLHVRLQTECKASAVAEQNPDAAPASLRQAVMRAMDEALQLIPDLKREAMYRHARSLGSLRDLSCFLFDRFVNSFEETATGRACRVGPATREALAGLDKVLFSFKDTPALSLFESLFVYELETRAGEPGFDMDAEMASLLDQAAEALETIRGFSARVPLARVIRCATRNTGYAPAQTTGGEDWFQVYRGYWKQRLESDLCDYFAQKKRRDIEDSLLDFFGSRPEPLANAASEANPDGFPLPEAFALSFLKAFHSILHGSVNNALRLIIMEGEFARRDDWSAMTESYNDVIYAAEKVQALDAKLAANSEHGKRLALAKGETEALFVKRRKIQLIQSDASKEAWEIISRSGDGMRKMSVVLEAIASQETGGGQSCLTNFAKLAGRNPAAFARGVAEIASKLRKATQVLTAINSMDRLD